MEDDFYGLYEERPVTIPRWLEVLDMIARTEEDNITIFNRRVCNLADPIGEEDAVNLKTCRELIKKELKAVPQETQSGSIENLKQFDQELKAVAQETQSGSIENLKQFDQELKAVAQETQSGSIENPVQFDQELKAVPQNSSTVQFDQNEQEAGIISTSPLVLDLLASENADEKVRVKRHGKKRFRANY
jgi:hypothetical protein